MKKYIVLREFADKDNLRKHYNPGDKLPGSFSEDRIANIVKLGLAKLEGDTPVTDIDLAGKSADIVAAAKGFADIEKLKQYLEAERAAEKPRQTVIKAIEDRIANIVKE
jgi:hypothetical protein